MSNPTEGWMAEKPHSSRVYHYIVDTRSLCGRWGLYQGELSPFEPGELKARKDCAQCYRLATKRAEGR